MTEYTGHFQIHCIQLLSKQHKFFPLEAETVHAGFQLDVDGILFIYPTFIQRVPEEFKNPETVYFRLQIIFYNGIITVLLGIHYDDWCSNAILSQVHTLIGICDSKIIYMMMLKKFSYFIAAEAVRVDFDDRHHSGFRRSEERR